MGLTNKQQAFVEHYLGDAQWNASKAARRAGYKHPGQQGHRLLKNIEVEQHIRNRLCAMGATTDALMARWLTRIEADISPFVDNNGLDVEGLKEAGLGHLIKGVRETKDATTILLRDPDLAEERLARHLGMFKLALVGPNNGPVKWEIREVDNWRAGDNGEQTNNL